MGGVVLPYIKREEIAAVEMCYIQYCYRVKQDLSSQFSAWRATGHGFYRSLLRLSVMEEMSFFLSIITDNRYSY